MLYFKRNSYLEIEEFRMQFLPERRILTLTMASQSFKPWKKTKETKETKDRRPRTLKKTYKQHKNQRSSRIPRGILGQALYFPGSFFLFFFSGFWAFFLWFLWFLLFSFRVWSFVKPLWVLGSSFLEGIASWTPRFQGGIPFEIEHSR